MNPGPDDVHVLLGAYVLGGLSDEDHRTYSEHLRTCGPCQAELGQVSGLPRLLDLAGPEGGPHLADGPAAVPEPLSTEQGDARVTTLLGEVARRRRRRRAWLTALAAAAAVIFFAGGAWLGPSLVATTTTTPPTASTTAGGGPRGGGRRPRQLGPDRRRAREARLGHPARHRLRGHADQRRARPLGHRREGPGRDCRLLARDGSRILPRHRRNSAEPQRDPDPRGAHRHGEGARLRPDVTWRLRARGAGSSEVA